MTAYEPADSRDISTALFRGRVIAGSYIERFIENGGNPDDLFSKDCLILKLSRSTRTALAKVPGSSRECPLRNLFIKEYRYKHPLHPLKFFIFKHRAPLVWNMSWRLLGSGIEVPRPLGFLLKALGPYYVKGYFFSDALTDACTLQEVAKDAAETVRRLDSGRVMELAALKAARMHESGVAHGDFNWSNLLLHKEQDRLWVVDLDAARIHKASSNPSPFARDLARFVLHAGELGVRKELVDRFLDAYARERRLTLEMLNETVGKASERLARKDRRPRRFPYLG